MNLPANLKIIIPAILLFVFALAGRGEVRLSPFVAYLEPDSGPARISRRSGSISGWSDPAQKIFWFAWIKTTGKLDCAVTLSLPTNAESKLRLTVGNVSHEATVKGSTNEVAASFGAFEVATNGYQKLTLESLKPAGQSAGNVTALLLSGPATQGALYKRVPAQRGAPSTHLSYSAPRGEDVEAFYCEVIGVEDPVPSYYMACGWHRGYFGMQVNSPTERRIIFSVWDSGNEGVSREKVANEDRVTLVAKGDGVFSGDFGNEGTGGHSHLVFDWKTGEKQKFLVTAKPVDATHTIYSGFWFHPEQKKWMLISSWKAPKEGGYLRGLYSFTEDFGGTGLLRRKALFGNQWVRNKNGKWFELTTARFSHTGENQRMDRCMGVENGEFFLAAGAFMPGTTEAGSLTNRPATGKSPSFQLPEIPVK